MPERPIDRIMRLLPQARKTPNGWYEDHCPCPEHQDAHASFGFCEKPDGTVVVKCQAGCTRSSILRALGLGEKDLFADNGGNGFGRPKIARTYDYVDKNGELVFQTVRREPGANGKKKDFRQRQPRRNGMDLTGRDGKPRYADAEWIWDMEGIRPVLWRLPEILDAVRDRRTIYLTEGEKAAEALVGLGLDATTSPMGAGKWRQHYADSIGGADVVCLPDNDEAGRSHMREAAESLRRAGCRVRVLELPDLPPHGDAFEWVQGGGTAEALAELLEDRFPQDEEGGEEDEAGREHGCTHISNAERLVEMFGDRFRYCSSLQRFIVYDGARWSQDDSFEVERLAHAVVRSIPQELDGISDPERRKAILAHAARSENDYSIRAMLNRCRPLPGVTVSATRFDVDPWLLNCANGTLDLRTGELRRHTPDDYLMKLTQVSYLPDARCPKWLEFLRVIMRGNEALITFLHRAIGYSLCGITRERCMFILHGGGRNGKSTLLNVVRRITGDYGMRTPTSTLMLAGKGSIPNDVARLCGRRFVTASEVGMRNDEVPQLDEGMIKDVTGGEPVNARFLHQEWFEFTPTFKLWLGTNHVPTIRGTDDAIWDRIRLVEFGQRFYIPGEERGADDLPADDTLQDALYSEAEGILAWAVRGCLDWQQSGLTYPAEVRRAVMGYRADMDALIRFIGVRCVRGKFMNVSASALYSAYTAWCDAEDILPESQTKFAARLKQKGFTKETTRRGVLWFGLDLAPDKPLPDGPDRADTQKHEGFSDYEPGCEEDLLEMR